MSNGSNDFQVALEEEEEEEEEEETRPSATPEPRVEEDDTKKETVDPEVGESDNLHAVECHSLIGTGGGKELETDEVNKEAQLTPQEEQDDDDAVEQEPVVEEIKLAEEPEQRYECIKREDSPTPETVAIEENSEPLKMDLEQPDEDDEEEEFQEDNSCEESREENSEQAEETNKLDSGSSSAAEETRPPSPDRKGSSANRIQPTKRKVRVTRFFTVIFFHFGMLFGKNNVLPLCKHLIAFFCYFLFLA